MENLWDVCKNCLKCCLHGSPTVLPKERELIIEKIGLDYFIPQDGGKYFSIGSFYKKEACPYLLGNGECSLHNLGCKPADCRSWPVGLTLEGNFTVDTECPAVKLLSGEYYKEARKIIEEAFNTPELRKIYYDNCKTGEWRVREVRE